MSGERGVHGPSVMFPSCHVSCQTLLMLLYPTSIFVGANTLRLKSENGRDVTTRTTIYRLILLFLHGRNYDILDSHTAVPWLRVPTVWLFCVQRTIIWKDSSKCQWNIDYSWNTCSCIYKLVIASTQQVFQCVRATVKHRIGGYIGNTLSSSPRRLYIT